MYYLTILTHGSTRKTSLNCCKKETNEMQLYVLIHDENLGTETCWKNFSKMKEAEQYMREANELNGVRAELKVVGAKHNANL